jgi:hypothetical protein
MGAMSDTPRANSQLATRPQGDLSHTRPSWAVHSLTEGDLLYGHGAVWSPPWSNDTAGSCYSLGFPRPTAPTSSLHRWPPRSPSSPNNYDGP